MKIRKRFAALLDVEDENNRLAQQFDVFMTILIAANVFALIFETVEAVHNIAPRFFLWFEYLSIAIFTGEYVLRLWTAVEHTKYREPIRGRIRYSLTPLAIIDFLAIAPFFAPFVGIDLRSIRVIRLFRLLRVAKLIRYSHALRTFGRVIHSRKEQLITILVFLGVLLVVASTLMYFVEHEPQPETFSSIPATMWWAIATLTTVGYGDVYPITAVGRLLASFIAILGIGVFALPTGILGAAFVEELHKEVPVHKCPNCDHVFSCSNVSKE